MNPLKARKNLILFIFLSLLLSVSPAFAGIGFDYSYISILPIPVIIVLALLLTISAFTFKKHRILTVFLLIGFSIILAFVSGFEEFRVWRYFELKVLLMLPFLIILNIVYVVIDGDDKRRNRRIVTSAVVGFAVLCVVIIMHSAGARHFIFQTQLHLCGYNLDTIGEALEKYRKDNSGKYPGTLAEITPEYLSALPRCFNNEVSEKTRDYVKSRYGKTTGDYQYAVSADCERYTLWCSGNNHAEYCEPDYPQYDSKYGIKKMVRDPMVYIL